MRLPKISKYPKTIEIHNDIWVVKFTGKMPRKGIVGWCDGDSKTIYIYSRQTPIKLFRTFIHECIHIMEEEYDFELPHEPQHSNNDVVRKMELAICDLLLNNF